MADPRKVVVWAFVSVAAVTVLVMGGGLFILGPGLILGVVVAVILHFTQRDVLPARDDSRGDWGPNLSRISFSVAGGLTFAAGSMTILLIGLPPLRWFLALSLPLGIAIGGVLHVARHDQTLVLWG